mgnify:CR=1 FL=1
MALDTMGDQETLAYNELKRAIVEGLYPAGYQVVERTLSQLLEMSRTPVRSAIKRLEAEGFLERGTNHRIYVVLPDERELLDTLYVRAALEGMASRLAARNGTEEDFAKLHQLILQMERTAQSDDELGVYHLSNQLHQKVISSCGNEQLMHIASNIYEKSTIYNFQILRGSQRSRVSVQEHREIVSRIVARDEDGAERVTREHIQIIIDEHIKRTSEQGKQNGKRLSVPWKG